MIVADAPSIVDYLLRTWSGVQAESVLTAPGADLQVPALCDVEVAAALRALVMREAMTVSRCEKALTAYLDLPLTRHAHTTLLPRILDLRHNMSAYDATYVALAERLDTPLLTTDLGLARAVEAFTSVPLAG